MDFSRTNYDGRVLPEWADGLGWCLSIFCISPIFVLAVYHLVTTHRANPDAHLIEVWGLHTETISIRCLLLLCYLEWIILEFKLCCEFRLKLHLLPLLKIIFLTFSMYVKANIYLAYNIIIYLIDYWIYNFIFNLLWNLVAFILTIEILFSSK